jgi:hypothetical protein
MTVKLCLNCKHFEFNEIGRGYEDSIDGGLACAKGQLATLYFSDKRFLEPIYISCELKPEDAKDLRKMLAAAGRCPDYSPEAA